MTMTCRPHELFGLWSIEPSHLNRYVELARGADLAKLRAEAKAAPAPSPGYRVRDDGIAVLDISGPMTKHPHSFQALFGGTSMVAARAAVRRAARDPEVEGIMLRVDSPGGTVAGLAALAVELRRARELKPLHAYADDLAASGGLLALAQGTRAWAGPNAEVGSIGVYAVLEDTSGVYEQRGVKVHVVSSAPPIKGAGVEGTEITEAQLAEWQRRVADTAAWFVGEVALGRGISQDAVQKLATGQVWIAERARELGLIDGVLSFDEAMGRLRDDIDARDARQLADLRAARAPKPAPRPSRSAAPPTSRTLSPAEVLEAQAKAAGVDVDRFLATPAGALAYRAYRRALVGG